jgi:UDP-N-acetylmuramoyl-tripeptide--D-alanyl-D-alanine ligase
MNIPELYELFRQYPSVQTDTRRLKEGDIFFALKGPNFDANAFAETALTNGAAYAIIDDPHYHQNAKTILVDDVLAALQQLALYHRNQFTIPFIAITGSNGKTTTKELMHAVLSGKYKTYTTAGNLNNHIGIPLTILRVGFDAEMAVIEMGANHVGEIASYCTYTLPDYGIINNVGKAHLEGFGGYEGVKKGKGELYDHLRAADGCAFVMWDYDYLREMSAGIKTIIKYGTADADVIGRITGNEPFLSVNVDGLDIQTKLVGAYNLPNILAAVAIGKYFGVPDQTIVASLQGYEPSNSRSQLVEKNGNRIILDAYNANPSSMRLAVENFAALKDANKILVLGAMAELGENSTAEHQAIIELIKKYPWTDVVLVGGEFLKVNGGFKVFQTSEEAAVWFRGAGIAGSLLLIKGSRSMKMEKVIE